MKPSATKVGNDLGAELPSADPNDHIAEIARRSAVARSAAEEKSAASTLPADVLLKKRRAFEEANAGFFVCNFANKQFPTECDEPNIRVLGYYRTHEEAQARVMQLFTDPRVGSAPHIVHANVPFLIPFSEAAAMDVRHVSEKKSRFFQRHADEVREREEDFKAHVAEKKPGVMEKSSYHRRKMYLEEKKRRGKEQKKGVGAGVGAGAGSASAAPPPAPAQPARRLPEFGGAQKTTVLDPHAVQDPTITEMFTASNVGVGTGAGGPSSAAPNVLWKGELPAHWRDPSAPRNPNSFPRDLENRHGCRVVLTYLDDLDKPEDDPAYPDAAGKEPLFVLFGGEYENDAQGTTAAKEIGEWCTDLPLDVVDEYEWLWPTLVDPDKLNEEHRTSGAGLSAEQNKIMKQRKKTMQESATARAHAATLGIPLKETNVNDVVDVSQVVAHTQPGMFLQGEIEQYDKDAEGKLQRRVAPGMPALPAPASSLSSPTTGESKEEDVGGSGRLPFSLDDIPEV